MQIQDQLDQFEADLRVLWGGLFQGLREGPFEQSDEALRHRCCVAPFRQKNSKAGCLETSKELRAHQAQQAKEEEALKAGSRIESCDRKERPPGSENMLHE